MLRLAVLLSLAATPCFAHAVLIDSTPAPNAHAPAGALAIKFRYNSRIDTARSKLTLTGPDGVTTRLAARPGETPDLLRATATLAAGNYALRWQVLAKDGHITRGIVPFTVDAQ
jgi:copper resistance protein C